MGTRRNKMTRKNKTKRHWGGQRQMGGRKQMGGKKSKKSNKKSKQWKTAISAAQSTLTKTGDINKAQKVLKMQALANARKLFGSVGERM